MIPHGYILLEEREKELVIGVAFSEMGKEAPLYMEHEKVRYTRGPMEAIPTEYTRYLCSVRIYKI